MSRYLRAFVNLTSAYGRGANGFVGNNGVMAVDVLGMFDLCDWDFESEFNYEFDSEDQSFTLDGGFSGKNEESPEDSFGFDLNAQGEITGQLASASLDLGLDGSKGTENGNLSMSASASTNDSSNISIEGTTNIAGGELGIKGNISDDGSSSASMNFSREYGSEESGHTGKINIELDSDKNFNISIEGSIKY